MTTKIEEGSRNEPQARQLAQREMMNGLKNEENARQMVQNDLQTIKENIRQLESGSGSGSTVGSGKGPSGTFTRPPPGIGIRLNDFLYAEKDWNSKDGSQNTSTEVTKGSRRPRCRISSRTCTK